MKDGDKKTEKFKQLEVTIKGYTIRNNTLYKLTEK